MSGERVRRRMLRPIATFGLGLVALIAIDSCTLPRCAAGDTCVCDGAGNCSRYCDGVGCHFECAGAGDCYFDCLEGNCSVKATNAGNVYLSCEVGNCSMVCSNAGDCYVTYCPEGCTCDSVDQAGSCSLPLTPADAAGGG